MENLMGRYRNVSILAAAIFLQILGLAVQVKRQAHAQSTRLIRVWAVGAVTPLERVLVSVQNGATGLWHNYFYLRGVRQQNRQLEQQIQDLQLEQVRLRQDAEQAHRLQALLGFKEQFIDKTVAAQVIGSSGSEQSRIVYLDKGTADGIAPDMAVISKDGIVGKVVQTFRHTCQVLLINDQNSGVGTLFEQSRLQGVLKGTPNGDAVLDNIMSDEEITPGERVLTSGGDQIFPKGLPVGTVSKVTKGKEFLMVTVKPAAALNHLEEVLVITKKAQREAEVASSTPMRAADILAQRLPSVPDQPASTEGAAGSSGSGTSAMQTKPAANAAAPATQTPKTSSTQAGMKPVVSSTPGGVAGTKPVVSSAPGGAAGTKPIVSSTPGVAAIKPVVSSTSVAVQNSAAASAPHQATHVAGQPGTPTSAGTAQAQKNQVGSAVVMKPTTTSTAVTGTAPIKTEAAKKAQAVPVGTKTPNAAVPVKVPAQGAAPSTTPGTNTLQQPKPKPAGAATKPATAPPQSQAAPKIQSDSGGTPQ